MILRMTTAILLLFHSYQEQSHNKSRHSRSTAAATTGEQNTTKLPFQYNSTNTSSYLETLYSTKSKRELGFLDHFLSINNLPVW